MYMHLKKFKQVKIDEELKQTERRKKIFQLRENLKTCGHP